MKSSILSTGNNNKKVLTSVNRITDSNEGRVDKLAKESSDLIDEVERLMNEIIIKKRESKLKNQKTHGRKYDFNDM